jgi:hypothetical protein
MATEKAARASATGPIGSKEFSINKKKVTRKKAKEILGPLFNTMDKHKSNISRVVQATPSMRSSILFGGKDPSIPPGTTSRTKSLSPKGKSKPITKKKSK